MIEIIAMEILPRNDVEAPKIFALGADGFMYQLFGHGSPKPYWVALPGLPERD